MALRITYATMSADNDELNEAYERAIAAATEDSGHPWRDGGRRRAQRA